MPKIVSRSTISSSIDAPSTDSATASLRVYYCLCGEFILVIDKSLTSLPRRQTDGSIILRSQDAPNAKARVFKLNVNVAPQPVMIERKSEQGYLHERQYRLHCTRCDLMIGYQSTPAPTKSGPFVYILWGAVSQIQGQCPPEAFEGEEEALARAAAKDKDQGALSADWQAPYPRFLASSSTVLGRLYFYGLIAKMNFCDRTEEFRQCVQACASKTPDAKKRKGDVSKRSVQAEEEAFARQYLTEAYTILNHLKTLTQLLSSVRRPYLNVDSNNHFRPANATRHLDLNDMSSDAWAGIKSLTNAERDQLDLQANVILTKCAQRVRELEQLDKQHTDLVASRANPLLRMLPSRLTQSTEIADSDTRALHRSNITWYLTRRLTETGAAQRDMQEERVRRQVERATTLGSTMSAPPMPAPTPSTSSSGWGTSSWRGTTQPAPAPVPPPEESEEDDYDDLELSTSQILQFEQENAALLRSVEDTLASVKVAESRLLDISALQTELVAHLTRQTEVVDHLYDEAIASQGDVKRANVQLRKARENQADSRIYLIVFLMGASAALLFIHWYN